MRLSDENCPPRAFKQLRWLLSRPRVVLRRRYRLKRTRSNNTNCSAGYEPALHSNKTADIRMQDLHLALLEMNRWYVLDSAVCLPPLRAFQAHAHALTQRRGDSQENASRRYSSIKIFTILLIQVNMLFVTPKVFASRVSKQTRTYNVNMFHVYTYYSRQSGLRNGVHVSYCLNYDRLLVQLGA